MIKTNEVIDKETILNNKNILSFYKKVNTIINSDIKENEKLILCYIAHNDFIINECIENNDYICKYKKNIGNDNDF